MTKYLTPEGLEKLKKELEHLRTVTRREIAERIKHAASFGDLSENAAYDEAKDAQSFAEGRIAELRNIISQARIINKIKNGSVQIGSIVHIKSDEEQEKFTIVAPEEVDVVDGKISYQSPLGRTLLNKREGVSVKVETPKGILKYKIIKIE